MGLDTVQFTNVVALVGLLITAVGIWLVVKQLKEARLASQMEGILALGDQLDELFESVDVLTKLISTEKWQKLDSQEARKLVLESKKYRATWRKLLTFYELIGVLVRRKALDENLAYDIFGDYVTLNWKRVEKVTLAQREEEGIENIGEHWEWLALKFEKRSA